MPKPEEEQPVDPEIAEDEESVVADQEAATDDEADEVESEGAEDSEGDEDEESEGDGDDGELGQRAQRRIKKLIAEKKEATAKFESAQKELEAARKLSGDDGRALLRAAEVTGILPGLMSRDEAEAFEDLDTLPRRIENYEDWLDDHDSDDTLTMGSTEMSYGDVKKRLRKLRSQYDCLKDEYGERRKELKAKVREIFETGVAALKAGWKPDKETKAEKKSEKRKLETRPKATSPKPKRGGEAGIEDMDVSSEEELEDYFARRRRK